MKTRRPNPIKIQGKRITPWTLTLPELYRIKAWIERLIEYKELENEVQAMKSK